MRRYPRNFGSVLVEMFGDKRIRPIFWIVTIIYFLLVTYLVVFKNGGSGSRIGVLGVITIPYFIFSVIYLFLAFGKKK